MNRINTWEGICYDGLALVIMETEKSHEMLPSSWRPSKAGYIAPAI